MSNLVTQLTAPNLSIEAVNGIRYAYRRFGNADAKLLPLVCLVHYRANLENWDPKFIDAVAAKREVILVNNRGVASTSGTTPNSVRDMAADAIYFIDALGLKRYDLLGFSLGGFIAQEVALLRPHQVRRLILAGTGPQGGRNMHMYASHILDIATKDRIAAEDILTLFFETTESSLAKGREFLARIMTRTVDRDPPASLVTRDAQMTAISEWGIPDPARLERLRAIRQPVLVANGDNDAMVPTENSYLLAEYLPNAKLSIYPDAGHGFLFQYPVEFAAEVNAFLGG